jgi:hypothetical protein
LFNAQKVSHFPLLETLGLENFPDLKIELRSRKQFVCIVKSKIGKHIAAAPLKDRLFLRMIHSLPPLRPDDSVSFYTSA